MLRLTEGAVVGMRYRLDRLLGAGGMGEVWAATHLVTGACVALKFLRGEADEDGELRMRFFREARAAVRVQHPNVIEVHDIFETEEHVPVMVMDLLEGESLRTRLDREGTLSIEDTGAVLLPVISAVGTAHARGVIHRDLKPDNVFLAHERVRVLDFGIAKLVDDYAAFDLRTISGVMLGTVAYAPPEQALGEAIDARVDVFAIGVMLYECLAGVPPIDTHSLGLYVQRILRGEMVPLHRRAPHVPREICTLVDRMLRADRNERLHDLREAAAILERYTSADALSFAGPRPFACSTAHTMLAAPRTTLDVGGTLRSTGVSSRIEKRSGAHTTALAVALALVMLVLVMYRSIMLADGGDRRVAIVRLDRSF